MILFGMGLVLLSSFLAALGAVYLKKGAKRLTLKFAEIIRNKDLIMGCFISALSAVVYISALTIERLSSVYPATAMVYIWTTILGYVMLKEQITANKVIGVGLIVAGIILISHF